MPARTSESFILQTYPFRESDLIVSFFTRDQGKLRGVAHRARRPKAPSAPDSNASPTPPCRIIKGSNYEASVALDYLAEVTEQLFPSNETNERHFRLLTAFPGDFRAGLR
jgi:DNA repair protein RecO (recombination protein O)